MSSDVETCYDKRLYERLRHGPGAAAHGHLTTTRNAWCGSWKTTAVPGGHRVRCPAGTGRRRHGAHQTGARLIHHGSSPVGAPGCRCSWVGTRDEPTDTAVAGFYRTLLDALSDSTFRDGRWRLAESYGWPGSAAENLAAWCWEGETRWLIVVNLGDQPATGRVPLSLVTGVAVVRPHSRCLLRSGNDLLDGLYVDLAAGDWHLWRVDPAGDEPPVAQPGTNGDDG